MKELEVSKLAAQLFPETPHGKVGVTCHCVVQKHHSARPQLGQPRVEIVLYCLVCMESIQVQEIDAAVRELLHGRVEGGYQEFRKVRIIVGIISAYFLKNSLIVSAGVLVPFPSVHRKTFARNAILLHSLTKAEIGLAVVGS
jgi:hypothetical protein